LQTKAKRKPCWKNNCRLCCDRWRFMCLIVKFNWLKIWSKKKPEKPAATVSILFNFCVSGFCVFSTSCAYYTHGTQLHVTLVVNAPTYHHSHTLAENVKKFFLAWVNQASVVFPPLWTFSKSPVLRLILVGFHFTAIQLDKGSKINAISI